MGKLKVLRMQDGSSVTDAAEAQSLAVDPTAAADGLDPADIPALLKAQQDYTAQAQATHAQQYQDAKDYLMKQQAGPGVSERLMQLGSALVAPMKMRGFAGMLGNVGPVMADQAAAVRTGEDERVKQLMLLQRQYGTDNLADAKNNVGFSMDLAKLRAAQLAKQAAAARQNGRQWRATPTGVVELPGPLDQIHVVHSQQEADAVPEGAWMQTPNMPAPMRKVSGGQ